MENRTIRRSNRNRQRILHLQLALVLTLTLLIAAFRSDVHYASSLEVQARGQELIEMPHISPSDHKQEEPPPARPPVPVEVPDDTIVETSDLLLDPIKIEIRFSSGRSSRRTAQACSGRACAHGLCRTDAGTHWWHRVADENDLLS